MPCNGDGTPRLDLSGCVVHLPAADSGALGMVHFGEANTRWGVLHFGAAIKRPGWCMLVVGGVGLVDYLVASRSY